MTLDETGYLQDRITELERTNESLANRAYAAPHVWNLVAKTLREAYLTTPKNSTKKLAYNAAITEVAIRFAQRFKEDEGFDPVAWLDKCSPDTDLYPFSEMWDERK